MFVYGKNKAQNALLRMWNAFWSTIPITAGDDTKNQVSFNSLECISMDKSGLRLYTNWLEKNHLLVPPKTYLHSWLNPGLTLLLGLFIAALIKCYLLRQIKMDLVLASVN